MKKKNSDVKHYSTLRAIVLMTENKGYPPTVSALAKRFRVYPNAVQYRIESLVKYGYITKEPNQAKTIQLTKKGREAIK